MRQPLIAGNWKMNGSLAEARRLARAVASGATASPAELAVLPPYVHLPAVAEIVSETALALGAQNVADAASGAYTGEVSAGMLRELGCAYALVGHSERRAHYGETNALVAARFQVAQAGGLVPVLCVGETLAEREAGETEPVIAAQLDAVVEASGRGAFARAVVAYEPVWAIGTGHTATPAQAQAVHSFVRARVAAHSEADARALRVIYGGSMKPANAPALLAMDDVDGGLIGGAALVADDFLSICRAAG